MAHSIVRRSHSHYFVKQLNCNERNALRVILLHRDGLRDLSAALGILQIRVAPLAEQRTSLAVAGKASEPFRRFLTDISLDKSAEAAQ